MSWCRGCGKTKLTLFADLGHQPPSNKLLTKEQLSEPEIHYPLKAYVCNSCFLIQLGHQVDPKLLFDKNYPYFSSRNEQTVLSAKQYVAEMYQEFKPKSWLEIASNDGVLLENVKNLKVDHLGIEPCSSVARESLKKGINTKIDFFDGKSHLKYGRFDLITANNVLAHIPDINDFIKGIKKSLSKKGVATFEFHWAMDMLTFVKFDTIYHEHYYYLSLIALIPLFKKHGLDIFRVYCLQTHGQSLRIFVCHEKTREIDDSIGFYLNGEIDNGLNLLSMYQDFQNKIKQKCDEFVLKHIHKIDAYGYHYTPMSYGVGAAAKATVMINYLKLKLPFVVDETPHKIGKYIPGMHIPIVGPKALKGWNKSDAIIFPWNVKDIFEAKLSAWCNPK